MRLAHAANEVHPGHIATVRFKEELEKLVPGRVNVQIFPNRQLGDDKQCLEAAIAGTVDLAGASGVLFPLVTGRPALAAYQLPFLIRDYDHFTKLATGDVGQKMLDDLAPAGLIGLQTTDIGQRNFLSVGKQVKTIADFARCAALARRAGYDGVEIMGSEGYLLNQFVAARTNRRGDEWGGSYANRIRVAVETVRAVRGAVGSDFIVIFRLSMLDLVEGGSTWDEVVELALAVEDAGATMINTGIGWHEARVPTIATMVPRAAFAWVTARLKGRVRVPLVTTNRINDPAVAEALIARGDADMVSMARPFLADPAFVRKAAEGRADEINTCIACNQACLDHLFVGKSASCLVNPAACREADFEPKPAARKKRVAVVGSGPAGLACATTAAERGHAGTLFESARELGGQFNLAKRIPGKEEFHETLRYFARMIELRKVTARLGTRVDAAALAAEGFDEVIVATGIAPRTPAIPGIDHPKVVRYVDVITGRAPVGRTVAIMGAGGIGFDVAELITHEGTSAALDIDTFAREWGVDFRNHPRGGVTGIEPQVAHNSREVTLLQRKATPVGQGLGRTTGWTHRLTLQRRGVKMVSGVDYVKIDDAGLHCTIGGEPALLDVDTVIICAGQEPARGLHDELAALGIKSQLVGGAFEASELDAKQAIKQATELAVAM